METWSGSTEAALATSCLICSTVCSLFSYAKSLAFSPCCISLLIACESTSNSISSLLVAMAVLAPSVILTKAGGFEVATASSSVYCRFLVFGAGGSILVMRKVSLVLLFMKNFSSISRLVVVILLPQGVTKVIVVYLGLALAVTEFLTQFIPIIIPKPITNATTRTMAAIRKEHCILVNLPPQQVLQAYLADSSGCS